jgi:hypothetical protein
MGEAAGCIALAALRTPHTAYTVTTYTAAEIWPVLYAAFAIEPLQSPLRAPPYYIF